MPGFLDKTLQAICAVALMLMMSIGAIDIIMGELFDTFLPFKVEVSGYLFAVVVFLSLPLVAARGENIVVDVISSLFRGRVRWLADIACLLVTLTAITFYCIAAVQLFRFSWDIGEKSYGYLPIPIYPIKLLVGVGFGLAGLVSVVQLVARIRSMPRGAGDTAPRVGDAG